MSDTEPNSSLDPRTARDLARYADGTLPARRAAGLRSQFDRSAELRALLAEHERALAAVRRAAVPAPRGLRARVRADGETRGARVRRRGLATGGLAATVAVAALLLVLLLPAGTPGGPSLSAAAALARGAPTSGAPPLHPGSRALLATEQDEIPFPNWTPPFGWRAVGTRRDVLEERSTTTVFYVRGTRRIAYSIVGGTALARPARAGVVRRDGTEFRLLGLAGRTVVTWERRGHTCVLSAKGGDAGAHELLRLATWRAAGSLPY